MAGEINWFELAVDDTARATKFFGAVLGWETEPFEGEDYHLISGGSPGAIAPKSADLTANRIYFHVADLDAAVAKIAELGGKPGEPVPVPGMGRIAHCQDDQGTPFSLYQPS